jgi:hypothetical protein
VYYKKKLDYFLLTKLTLRLLASLKGTLSRDSDGLLVVWMDRALFVGEPLIVFYLSVACWFLTLNFTCFSSVPKSLHLCVLLGQPSCNLLEVAGNPLKDLLQVVSGYWQLSGKFCTWYQGVLATL